MDTSPKPGTPATGPIDFPRAAVWHAKAAKIDLDGADADETSAPAELTLTYLSAIAHALTSLAFSELSPPSRRKSHPPRFLSVPRRATDRLDGDDAQEAAGDDE